MNKSNLNDKSITHISIKRFKSIRELKRFQLGQVTVLAGANGAGKSNLLSFFRLLSNLANHRLDRYLALNGIDSFLHNGPEESEYMTFEIHFGQGEAYRLNIAAGARKDFFIENEEILEKNSIKWRLLSRHAHFEPKLTQEKNKTCRLISNIMRSWQMYHLQNTSTLSPMRRRRSLYHYERLEYDGSNLAPFLLHLSERHEDSYKEIQSAIRLVAPFLTDFLFISKEKKMIRLSNSCGTTNDRVIA